MATDSPRARLSHAIEPEGSIEVDGTEIGLYQTLEQKVSPMSLDAIGEERTPMAVEFALGRRTG